MTHLDSHRTPMRLESKVGWLLSRGRRALVPLTLVALGLLCLGWSWPLLHSAALAPLGRDHGIFQYTAFATAHGEALYRDIREFNGPLPHLIHRLFLTLGGASAVRFRALDLGVSALVYGLCGVLARRLWRPASDASEGWGLLAWALLAVALLGTQYLGYLPWDQAQRESFAVWFWLPSMLMICTERAPVQRFVWAGALLAFACAGKSTFCLYAPLYMLAAQLHGPRGRWQRLGGWVLGGCAGALLVTLATWWWLGDPLRGLVLSWLEAPQIYGNIHRLGALEILALPWLWSRFLFAASMSGLGALLIALRLWPRRLLPLALMPLVGLLAMLVQGKGYMYHAHPISASAWLLCLMMLISARRHSTSSVLASCGVSLVVLALAARTRWALMQTAAYDDRSVLALAAREERDELRLAYAEADRFHPQALSAVARWLSEDTAPGGRVQLYGIDPLLLFWAGRLSATPYLYEFDWDPALGADSAERHGREALRQLERSPPVSFVLLDGSPFMTEPTALAELTRTQPAIAAFLQRNYQHQRSAFGVAHWWRLRRAGAPDGPGATGTE